MELVTLLVVLGSFLFFALLNLWIAGEKNRSRTEGFLLGLFLGAFGVLIELLLPTKPEPRYRPGSPAPGSGSNWGAGCVTAIGIAAMVAICGFIATAILSRLNLR